MRNRPQRTRRRVGQRERSTVIRVLTEGEVTEREYLSLICRDSVKLQFGKSRSTPIQLVEQAKRDRSADQGSRTVNRLFDEIWCIFDRDDHHGFHEATRAAQRANIRTAVSNPCFELWLLLHVKQQTAYISTSEAQAQAGALNLIDGKNLAAAGLGTLESSYEVAKRRALELDKMHERNGSSRGSNPSSGVWRIADHLLDPSD